MAAKYALLNQAVIDSNQKVTKKAKRMIGMELVRELVETIIMTGKVREAQPVSLLLIAAPESGKTSVVLDRKCKNVEAFSDLTGKGILTVLQRNPSITHIIINDMVAVLSHKITVNRYTMAMINAMTEEGIENIATGGGFEHFNFGRRGIIASITLELAKDSRFWWNKIGFASRCLPFCYLYPDSLVIKIKDAIDLSFDGKGKIDIANVNAKEFRIPVNPVAVECSLEVIKAIRFLSDVRAQMLGEVGMRRLKQYHTLARAHALLRKRREVTEEDINFLKAIDYFISYTKPWPLKMQEYENPYMV